MLKKDLQNSFRPYYINECEDIKFTFKQIASQLNLNLDLLDFELRAITTYTKKTSDYSPQPLKESETDGFLNNYNNLLEPNLLISQHYSILIFKKEKKEMRFHMLTDKFFSKSFLVFRAGFVFNPNEFESLYTQIRKFKAWNKILFFNEAAEKKALKDFLNTLKYPLKQEVNYLLSQSFNYLPPNKCSFSYKKEITKGFQTIIANEVICIFQKALKGKPGRNIQGKYIIPEEPKTLGQPCMLKFDPASIKIQETPLEIRYIAIIGGVLKYEDNYLCIENSLKTKEVNLKTTGSLIGEIESGAEINITEADSLKEALGQGMKVQASKIDIQGNVGANAQINAKEVFVGGFTHQDSKIYATTANIKTHKGYLKAQNVKIQTLEAGIIKAQRVEVEQVYGGKIYAEEIFIQILHSNAFLHATKKIKVALMQKGENRFYIAANYSPQNKEKYQKLLEQKVSSIKEAITLIKELKIESLELKKFKGTADEIRQILIHYKNTHTTPPSYFLTKFEEYHTRILALKEKKAKINALSELSKQAYNALNKLDSATKEGVIEIQSGWVGYNEIHYLFYSPKQEFMLIPKIGEPSKVIFQNNQIHLVI